MKKIEACKNQKELEDYIIFLAEDLKRRAVDIANDYGKELSKIEIKSEIELGNVLEWQVKKIYNVELENKKTPMENRKDKKFNYYYDKIWRDLDVHI